MLRLLNIVTLALACAHIQAAAVKGNSTNPVVDLGNAGTYIGVLQNNGTVQAYVIYLSSESYLKLNS